MRGISVLIDAKCAENSCGKTFIPIKTWQSYCSQRCKHRANYNPVAQRFRQMLCQYGVSREQYDEFLTKGCWLCGNPFAKDEIPHVEHNHVTQKVRGLAHAACNAVIGHAKENPELLEAIAYALRRTSTSN